MHALCDCVLWPTSVLIMIVDLKPRLFMLTERERESRTSLIRNSAMNLNTNRSCWVGKPYSFMSLPFQDSSWEKK